MMLMPAPAASVMVHSKSGVKSRLGLRFGRMSAGTCLAVSIVALIASASFAQEVPKQAPAAAVSHPREHLGYEPGADFHLVDWATVTGYFRKLDAQSDRVALRTMGKTSQGRDMLLAVISSPETIADLPKVQRDQKLLADPRLVTDRATEDRLIGTSKPVVFITGTIHSSETAATFMLMELAWELASGREAWAREVLDKVVVAIVPSVNPDGIDIVAEWYARSLGKPWEGRGLPRLYHPYAGHDTNRDFYALNLPETVNLSKVLYEEWFPTVLWDVHQMGSEGARLFVPPFFDPTNPNVDPRITQSILLIGAHMAADLAAAGKKGVLHSAMYDNWWNGGNRTTPQRHNMVAILTEAASVRLASPIFLAPNDLKGGARGFDDHRPTVNFPDPWPGGWWRLRDIVEYEAIAARSLLTLVARYGKSFQANYLAMGRDQLLRGETEGPYGWLVPLDQHDPAATRRMLNTLAKTGIEVHRTTKEITLYGTTYPAGTWHLPARQPYRAHLKDMMERQKYPNRFTAGGQAETPYDVAGWTMPLLMGVRSVEIKEPVAVESQRFQDWRQPRMTVEGDLAKAKTLLVENRSTDDLTLIQALIDAGVQIRFHAKSLELPGRSLGTGFAEIEPGEAARKTIDALADRIGSHLIALEKPISREGVTYDLKSQRVALYQPWDPSMNEGWTRLVLERLGIPYTTVHRDDILAGRLRDRFDCLVFPSVSARSLRQGYRPGESEPAYVGGLEGAKDLLKEFVAKGGTIVAIENSCGYVIEELGLPVENAVASLTSRDFYGPGSILAAAGEAGHPLTFGMPEKFSVYFDRSLGLKSAAKPGNESSTKLETAVRYGTDSTTLLESGWLLGPEKLSGLTALGECQVGQGRVVLFAFPAQNRAQTAGTFRLLVNALWRGGMRRSETAKTAGSSDPVRSGDVPAGAVGLVE